MSIKNKNYCTMKTMQKYVLMIKIGIKHCERPYTCQCLKALLKEFHMDRYAAVDRVPNCLYWIVLLGVDNSFWPVYPKPMQQRGKAITLQAWRGPPGSRRLRLPDFKTIGT